MTWKPRPARRRQKSSSQLSICAPRPAISRSGAAWGSPKVSYSSSIPFVLARGIETMLLIGRGQLVTGALQGRQAVHLGRGERLYRQGRLGAGGGHDPRLADRTCRDLEASWRPSRQ